MLARSLRPSRAARSLTLETLESRLNLSGVNTLVVPAAIATLPYAGETATTSSSPRIALSAGATSPWAGATTIGIDDYSNIYNSRYEVRASGPNIGWVSPQGAFVEYNVHVANAGTYNLALGLASMNGANLNVSVNGNWQAYISDSATGSWDVYRTKTASIQLAAGNNVIRISAAHGTQYNLNHLSFEASGTAPTNVIGNDAWLDVRNYASITGAKTETRTFGTNIGYVSTAGAVIDYQIQVLTAGTYNLTLGMANTSIASLDVSIDGAKAASFISAPTGSWDNYQSRTQAITLSAGTHTLRIASTGGTQFNLNSIHLQRQTSTSIPAPTTPPATNTPFNVSVNERWQTSYTALEITGTSSGDSIYITQSGNTLTINANGATKSFTGDYGELIIRGGDGNDIITVDASVSLDTRLFGNGGSNTLRNSTQGRATIVSIGAGTDTLTGNGINTSFWADNADIVNASSAESAAGRVHRVGSFYQPYTTTQGAYGYVPLELAGQNLVDPAHGGSGTTRLNNNSLWGKGPAIEDINQGQVADCYFLTPMQSLARYQPERLRELAVDLGDGTYAIQFKRNGNTQYVRVDGDLPTNSWGGLHYNRPGASGNQWVAIMEKAYAYFRTAKNSYDSLAYGWMTNVYNDFGITASTFSLSDQNTWYANVSAKLAANKPVDIGTNGVVNGAPLATRHTYSVVNTWKDGGGTIWVTLRNTWGFDGYGNDGNTSDALLTMTFATLRGAVNSGTMVA